MGHVCLIHLEVDNLAAEVCIPYLDSWRFPLNDSFLIAVCCASIPHPTVMTALLEVVDNRHGG
jgi:hypothetical protein